MRRFLRMEPLEERRMLTMVAVPSSTVGELSTFGEVDSYTFNAEAGTDYFITAEFLVASATMDWQGTGFRLVLQHEGGDLFGSLTLSGGVKSQAYIRWTPPTDSTYELLVFDAEAQGVYTLDIEVAVDDHGDSPSQATSLPVPSVTAGSLATTDDVDVFTFSSEAGELYRMDLNPGTLMEVHDSNGVKLFGNRCDSRRGCDPAEFSFVTPDTSDYYVTVRNGGNYSLEIEQVSYSDDHGNLPISASALTATRPMFGQFEVQGDTDFFSFEAAKSNQYNISTLFTEGTTDLIVSSIVRVYDIDGTTTLLRDDQGAVWFEGGQYSSFSTWTAPTDGTYFIEMISPNYKNRTSDILLGDYIVRLEVALEDDHGGSLESATPILVPSQNAGRFNFPTDTDVFSFEALAGQHFRVDDDGSRGRTISVIAPDGVTEIVARRGFDEEPLRWTASTDGVYYVSVEASFELTDYTLSIESPSALPCDFVGFGNGCDIADLHALQVSSESDVTNASISEWLAQASSVSNPAKARAGDVYRLGDTDLDGDVDTEDLGNLLNGFGKSGLWSEGNLNADVEVDSADLGLLLNEFGAVSPMSALATSAKRTATSDFAIRDLVFGDSGEADDEESDGWRTGRMGPRLR